MEMNREGKKGKGGGGHTKDRWEERERHKEGWRWAKNGAGDGKEGGGARKSLVVLELNWGTRFLPSNLETLHSFFGRRNLTL